MVTMNTSLYFRFLQSAPGIISKKETEEKIIIVNAIEFDASCICFHINFYYWNWLSIRNVVLRLNFELRVYLVDNYFFLVYWECILLKQSLVSEKLIQNYVVRVLDFTFQIFSYGFNSKFLLINKLKYLKVKFHFKVWVILSIEKR